jgi:Tol biopolymer transport system component
MFNFKLSSSKPCPSCNTASKRRRQKINLLGAVSAGIVLLILTMASPTHSRPQDPDKQTPAKQQAAKAGDAESKVSFEEKLLAFSKDYLNEAIFSPDGSKVVYVEQQGDKYLLMVNGKSEGEYVLFNNFLANRRFGVASEESTFPAVFSPDGSKLVYIANGAVLINGNRGPLFDEIQRSSLVFSPDGSKVAYFAKQGKKWLAVVNDRKGPEFDTVLFPVFSPDGSKLAYVANQKDNLVVMVNNESGPAFEGICSPPVFSPDGSKVAYIVREFRKKKKDGSTTGKDFRRLYFFTYFVVVNDKRGPEFDDIGPSYATIFNSDGSKLAYPAIEGSKEGTKFFWRVMDVK